MNIREPSLSSPISVKIDWAEKCFRSYRDIFTSDPFLVGLMTKLSRATELSRLQMKRAGISELCRQCELEEGGSCCGAGVENRYSASLLLVNLLIGTTLPRDRYDDTSCFFLGQSGCVLKARHAICVNYICGKITANVGSGLINSLRETEGDELEALFRFNEQIKLVLRNPGYF